MIISDQHRFVFVHIPKCAGTMVRRCLAEFDNQGERSIDPTVSHPTLGMVKRDHIPLKDISLFYPEMWSKLADYESFAIVRNPRERFYSSVSQYLREFQGQRIHTMTNRELSSVVGGKIGTLLTQLAQLKFDGRMFPQKFIHFQPQCDYVFCDGKQMIKNIFLISEVDALIAELSRITGVTIQKSAPVPTFDNRTMVYRSSTLRLCVESMRKVVQPVVPLMPKLLIAKIKDILFEPFKPSIDMTFEYGAINDFILKYYSNDLELFNKIEATRRKSARESVIDSQNLT